MSFTLGIDIGGSGIKGAPADLDKGEFALPRLRIPTPQPSTPRACAQVIGEIADHFGDEAPGPVGITVPAPVIHGVTPSMANLDQSWTGFTAQDFLAEQAVTYPLFHRKLITAYNGDKVTNFKPIASTGLDLVGVGLK
mgnify:FL=1